MKLELIGHDHKYVVEQSLLALFPEERPVYGSVDRAALRAGLALAVFRERGLIALSAHGDQMTLSLNPIQGKVDLFASPYLSRLREDPAGRNGGAVS